MNNRPDSEGGGAKDAAKSPAGKNSKLQTAKSRETSSPKIKAGSSLSLRKVVANDIADQLELERRWSRHLQNPSAAFSSEQFWAQVKTRKAN
jgi:hypothetical protein